MATTDWERRGGWQAVVLIAIILAIGALHLARSAIVPVLFAMFLAMLLLRRSALRRFVCRVWSAAAVVVVSLIAVVGLALSATWRPARDGSTRRRRRCACWSESCARLPVCWPRSSRFPNRPAAWPVRWRPAMPTRRPPAIVDANRDSREHPGLAARHCNDPDGDLLPACGRPVAC